MMRVRVMKNFINQIIYSVRLPGLWRAFRLESHLTYDERVVLYRLAHAASTALEIGSYLGASALCLSSGLLGRDGARLICIDTWNNDAMTEGNRDTWTEFRSNTSRFSDCIIPVRGLSSEVVGEVRKIASGLDLLFIDGDHSYNGAKTDWESYKDFLKPGSIVVFHDYGWAEGVQRVVYEDVMPLVSGYNQLPNMWWGTLAKQP